MEGCVRGDVKINKTLVRSAMTFGLETKMVWTCDSGDVGAVRQEVKKYNKKNGND